MRTIKGRHVIAKSLLTKQAKEGKEGIYLQSTEKEKWGPLETAVEFETVAKGFSAKRRIFGKHYGIEVRTIEDHENE